MSKIFSREDNQALTDSHCWHMHMAAERAPKQEAPSQIWRRQCLILQAFVEKQSSADSCRRPTLIPCPGAGTRLLERTLEKAAEDPNVEEAVLHVQTSNDEAIRFYEKNGFKVVSTIEGYYKKNRLDPPDAHVLTKALRDS